MPSLQKLLLYLACAALPTTYGELLLSGGLFPFNQNARQASEANPNSTYPSLVGITWRKGGSATSVPMNLIGGGVIWNDDYILTAASVYKNVYRRLKETGTSDYMLLQLGGHKYETGRRDRDYEWDTEIELVKWPEWYNEKNATVGNIAVQKSSSSSFSEYLEKQSDKVRCICEPQVPAEYSTGDCLAFGYTFPGEMKHGLPDGLCTINARISDISSTAELVAVELFGWDVPSCLFEGSPLVCRIADTTNATNTLVGIGTGERNRKQNLLFTRVYKYLNWIEKTVGEPLTPTQPPPPYGPTPASNLPTKITPAPSSASSINYLGAIATTCSLSILSWLCQ